MPGRGRGRRGGLRTFGEKVGQHADEYHVGGRDGDKACANGGNSLAFICIDPPDCERFGRDLGERCYLQVSCAAPPCFLRLPRAEGRGDGVPGPFQKARARGDDPMNGGHVWDAIKAPNLIENDGYIAARMRFADVPDHVFPLLLVLRF